MEDLKRSTERVGLNIHPDKTNILSNQRSNRQSGATIEIIKVERDITDNSVRATRDDRNRKTESGQRGHHSPQELTSKSYLLRHRLRLFNMVITPTLHTVLARGHYRKNM